MVEKNRHIYYLVQSVYAYTKKHDPSQNSVCSQVTATTGSTNC